MHFVDGFDDLGLLHRFPIDMLQVIDRAENAGTDRDLFLYEPFGESRPVIILQLMTDENTDIVQFRDTGEQQSAGNGIMSSFAFLEVLQFACEDLLRHVDLADLVQRSSAEDRLSLIGCHGQFLNEPCDDLLGLLCPFGGIGDVHSDKGRQQIEHPLITLVQHFVRFE